MTRTYGGYDPHAQLNLILPDEHGMAYLDLGGNPQSVKQVEGKVLYDLDEQGKVIGVEFLFAPKNWLIKGEQK
jgi:uncharacterized protein YuzE